MKKVLILTVTAGEGHNSVAKSIKQKFECYENVTVKVIDIFKEYSSKTKVFFIDEGYRAACKYALGIYNMIYRNLSKREPYKRETSPAQKTVEKETPYVLKAILDFQPDIIISTHFYGAIILTNIRQICNLNAKTGVILTDYCVHPFWEAATGVDYIFTPNDDMNSLLKIKGFKQEQIKSFGLPASQKFSNYLEKYECRNKLGLSKDMFTVMLMTGGGGFGGIVNLFKSLLKVHTPIQIVAINGKDKNSKASIDKYIQSSNCEHKILNLGYVSNVEQFMYASDCMVGKCGGITLTECLCAKLPLITVTKLAEQENENLKYLLSKNACFIIDSKHKLNKTIDNIIKQPELLKEKVNVIENIRKPNAINDICDFMLEFPKFDYSNIKLIKKISNKEIIKNIKTVKKYVKNIDEKKILIKQKKDKKTANNFKNKTKKIKTTKNTF